MASKPQSSEMHPGPGFRVRMNYPRPSAEVMRQLATFATPDISDLLNRLYALNPEIRRLSGPEQTLFGPACTVKVFPGDNLMVHKALDVAEPGDVIVVDAGASPMNAVLGDLISTKAKHRRIAGFIIDGLVRDLPKIRELDYPVYARGTTPTGPLHRGPGEINHAISCGGVVVAPGDVVIADDAGVVSVPQDIAVELLARLQQRSAGEAAYLDSVKRGVFSNDWVDKILEQYQCPIARGDSPAAALSSTPPADVVPAATQEAIHK